MTTTPRKYMDDKTHFKVMSLMTEHLQQIGNSNEVRYELGWNDERICAETGAEGKAVERLRLRAFGKLAPKADQTKAEASLLDQLVAKHNALARALMPLDPSFLIGE